MPTKITTKQRAARRRNIEIARRAKKSGSKGRSTGSAKYKAAYKKQYKKSFAEIKKWGGTKQAKMFSRVEASTAATKAAPGYAKKKVRKRAYKQGIRKGYSKRGATALAKGAVRSVDMGGGASRWLYGKIRL
jgi:hypothetical protein